MLFSSRWCVLSCLLRSTLTLSLYLFYTLVFSPLLNLPVSSGATDPCFRMQNVSPSDAQHQFARIEQAKYVWVSSRRRILYSSTVSVWQAKTSHYKLVSVPIPGICSSKIACKLKEFVMCISLCTVSLIVLVFANIMVWRASREHRGGASFQYQLKLILII